MNNLMKSTKEFLWNIGILKTCPWCNGKLEKVGTIKDFWQYFRCTNLICRFGK